jgi:hypothetical protein
VALTSCDESSVADGTQHVIKHSEGGVCAPDKTTAEEGGEEENAVGELEVGTGLVELVEEPMDVEERGGEFIEDERWTVEVDERSLQ